MEEARCVSWRNATSTLWEWRYWKTLDCSGGELRPWTLRDNQLRAKGTGGKTMTQPPNLGIQEPLRQGENGGEGSIETIRQTGEVSTCSAGFNRKLRSHNVVIVCCPVLSSVIRVKRAWIKKPFGLMKMEGAIVRANQWPAVGWSRSPKDIHT